MGAAPVKHAWAITLFHMSSLIHEHRGLPLSRACLQVAKAQRVASQRASELAVAAADARKAAVQAREAALSAPPAPVSTGLVMIQARLWDLPAYLYASY
jgi:hypothetical protein